MPLFTLKKKERLNKRGLIDRLFSEGEAFVSYPIRFIYFSVSKDSTESPVKVLFSAPKRRFKKAVDRNKLKRQMREAYRINKGLLNLESDQANQLVIAFQYIAKTEESFDLINIGIAKGLGKLSVLNA